MDGESAGVLRTVVQLRYDTGVATRTPCRSSRTFLSASDSGTKVDYRNGSGRPGVVNEIASDAFFDTVSIAKGAEMSFVVHVDDRESAGPVVGLLSQSPEFQVTATRLKLGDYLVEGKFLFERKTLSDLVVSIISGRLFTQAARLAASSLRPAIILEGTAQELAESGMTWESIQGALITVTLFYGIPLLRTRTPAETVRTMLFASQQHQAYATDALPRPGYRPRGKRARQLFILQGLPGIGPKRARQLIARFGTVQAVAAASTEDLASVPGISSEAAEKLRWILEEPRFDYPSAATGRV